MSQAPGFGSYVISKITTFADGLRSFTLDQLRPSFEPGQFFQIGLELGTGRIKRSYSAASASDAPLEFLLSEVPKGELTPPLFRLREGETMLVDPTPLGFFTLKEVPSDTEELWLISTGTGLGPSLSMLRTSGSLSRFSSVVVVHGARTKGELAYSAELQGRHDGTRIRYLPVVSREEPPTGGITGRITRAFETGALEKGAGLGIGEKSHILLCGNPQMIEDMTALLKARGLRKHRRREPGHYNFEKYW